MIKFNPISFVKKDGLKATEEAQKIVQNVENATKKVVYDPMKCLERTPEKDLLKRRNYMQSPEFWNDPDNKKMMELSDELMSVRDYASRKLENDLYYKRNYIQCPDGYLVNKRDDPMEGINPKVFGGRRIRVPDLTDSNVALSVANRKIMNHALTVQNKPIPLWCWPEEIAGWSKGIGYLFKQK